MSLKQLTGTEHSDYAVSLENRLASLLVMRQLYIALDTAREIYRIRSKVFGPDHELSQRALKWEECLLQAYESPEPENDLLLKENPSNDFRMCNSCKKVVKQTPEVTMSTCPYCRFYFLCKACPKANLGMDGHLVVCPKAPDVLPDAESNCRGCCKLDGKVKWCDSRKSIKYCSVECQRSDWKRHRNPCRQKKNELNGW